MQFDIIAIGKNTDQFIQQQIKEYCKRIISPVEIKELKTIKKSTLHAQRLYEADLIKSKLTPKTVNIVLEINGLNISSDELAQRINNFRFDGQQHFCFIIGGAEGLHPSITDMADLKLSFGRVTWPHMLMRVLILEQLYRCQQIMAGHPYHR